MEFMKCKCNSDVINNNSIHNSISLDVVCKSESHSVFYYLLETEIIRIKSDENENKVCRSYEIDMQGNVDALLRIIV